ncbi:hypothetical protein F0562_018494 [Nyssa sinensis]|uniref:Uncharacterized protein n=1 Tax=Nyssa sinensis TaxID=561372 RepID=A0A5J4ZC34_9ASTE|nr:hypothetical protein F0562_018494 [Nyssa sinensis]
MRTLIAETITCKLNPIFLYHFPSLSRKNPNFLNFSHRKWLHHPKTLTYCSATASDSPSYSGWDDLGLSNDWIQSGESNQLRNFRNSLGIDDKRYIFMYLLGFVCALAISRVRVSSVLVFPAFVLIFAVGFSFGFVNGGHVNELSLIGTKKRTKDENFKVSFEKLRNLVDLFNGFDGKISSLRNDVKRGIECNQITVGDLESYVRAMDSISLSALNARNSVEAYIDSMLAENQEVERTLNQKSSRRKKEVGEIGFDLLQLIGSLFQENSFSSKTNKMKDSIKRNSTPLEVYDHSPGNVVAPIVEERALNSVLNASADFSGHTSNKPDMVWDGAENIVNNTRRINVPVENDKMNFAEIHSSAKKNLDGKEYSYQNDRLRFMNNHQMSLKMGHHKEVETWASPDGLLDSVGFSAGLHLETEESFRQERTLEKSNGNYRPSDRREKTEKEAYRSRFKEDRMTTDDDSSLADRQSAHEGDFHSTPSSMISDDMAFNRYLMEANILLKQARECLRHRGDEEHAENVLYKSAKLLSKAIDMKPMSLLAVGQLGNTYLLHGELKLKISRELRSLLASRDPLSVEKWRKLLEGVDHQLTGKDKVASALINVCEECEELLVEAGRKYRLALSIDANDMRALYNWGLALSFRAQLIADIGPEAAFDADKVFLAAIDKFDAMMSKSNVYAPDALFRWGVTLQQRSRLRPRNSKEKVKLLQQAKRLYEDALDMDSDNLQVREALLSCLSELNFRNY